MLMSLLFSALLCFAFTVGSDGHEMECKTDPPSWRHFDFCKLIPFWHHHSVHIGKQLTFMHDMKGKMEDGSAVTLNEIEMVDLVIPNCQAIVIKNNLTVQVQGLGVDLSASAAGEYKGKVQAHVVVGDVEFNLHECTFK